MKHKKWLQKEPFVSPIPLYDEIGKKRKFLPIFFVKKLEEEKGLREGLRVRIIEPAKKRKEKKGGGTPCRLRGRFSN